jgi:subtilisin family serine protease
MTVPTPPSEPLMARLAGSYGTSVAWFRAHGIRVVNMSWWDRPSNYEDALEKNGIGKDAEERKRLARHYFTIERDALYAALKSAPEILFVTIAGNNNADNAFEETIPSSFKLPNLIVVGAVDQGGGRTDFTSTGQNIGVYADGYQVESVVPGGARVRLSGTSMAAPAVTNLAAKLLAVDPALTPVQVIDVMERNADPGNVDDIKLLNPRRSLAAVQNLLPK